MTTGASPRSDARGSGRLPAVRPVLPALATGALLLVSVVGCGMRPPQVQGGVLGEASGPFSLTVRAVNGTPDAVPVAIYLVSDEGSREKIGEVPPGEDRVIALDRPRPKGAYRLGAERPDGERIASDSFRLDADATVHWRLPDGALRMVRHREGSGGRGGAPPTPGR